MAAPKKIGPYETWLRDALATDARRPRRERRTALKLYAQLQAQGFPGSYARVTECIRAWRAAQGAVSARSAFVPLSFAWGEAFQFDWSDEGVVIGGVWRKVQLAHMKLCASRAFWLVGYPSQGHEMLFDAHTRCLTGLGGVAGRGIYDNMKTAVDLTPRKDRGRVVNARFAAMAAHYCSSRISAMSRRAGRRAASRRACRIRVAGSGRRPSTSALPVSPSSMRGYRPSVWPPGRRPILNSRA